MTKNKGLWLAFGDGPRAERIAERIHEDDTFTEVLSVSEEVPRLAELVLVSLGGDTVDYLGISEKGRLVATDKATVRVSNLFPLVGVSKSALRERLPKRHESVYLPSDGPSRISPRAWEELLKAVSAERPDAEAALLDLHARVRAARGRRSKRDGGVIALERDAIGLALETWGGPKLRKRVLRSARPASHSPAPFVRQLSHPTLREDIQIEHDHGVFPGFDVVTRYKVGAVEFRNPAGETLTIVNANRQPLERTLGVDLIYYTHRFRAFTLVQYKRMTASGSGRPVYRSSGDGNFKPELERIANMEAALYGEPGAGRKPRLDDFRLSDQPFFFKFCEATMLGALDPSMISGMYVPVDLVRGMLGEALAAGQKGLIVRWSTCPRRLSNTEFTTLLRSGWIGSSNARSEALSELIGAVLESGRMIVYAAASQRTERDHRRDDRGRFAEDDDPLASL